jgi:hypothetical protein
MTISSPQSRKGRRVNVLFHLPLKRRQMKTITPSAIWVHFNSARQGSSLFLFALVYIPLIFSGAQRKGIIPPLRDSANFAPNEHSEWAVKLTL